MRYPILLVLIVTVFSGCSSEGDKIADPTERGLAYIAVAIFLHALLQPDPKK